MSPSHDLQQQVAKRAANRCEYCRMHQSLQGASFHVEHIIPKSRGGSSELDNLAWACPGCNLHKADRIEVTDPSSGDVVALFVPNHGMRPLFPVLTLNLNPLAGDLRQEGFSWFARG